MNRDAEYNFFKKIKVYENGYIFEALGEKSIVKFICDGIEYELSKIPIQRKNNNELFLSYSLQDVLDSGKDILGNRIIDKMMSIDSLTGILPDYDDSSYVFIGFHTSSRSITVDSNGNVHIMSNSVYHNGEYSQPKEPVYCVMDYFSEEIIKSEQFFLNQYIPILYNILIGKNHTLETVYITEKSDYGTEPSIVIRHILYNNETKNVIKEEYLNVSLYTKGNIGHIPEDTFYQMYYNQLQYWKEFEENITEINIPDKSLERCFKGSMMLLDCSLNGGQPVYGHRNYGTEAHSHFPPAFITSLISLAMSNQSCKARMLVEYFLLHMVDVRGNIIYRQGINQNLASSGSEYGQILWFINKYEASIGSDLWLGDGIRVLMKIGDMLLSNIAFSQKYKNRHIIKMCAEADSNDRVSEYVQNVHWVIKGLKALSDLTLRYNKYNPEYNAAADLLKNDMDYILENEKVTCKFGELVPFRIGYSAIPLNLSLCKEYAFDIDEDELHNYLEGVDVAHDRIESSTIEKEQDIFENYYANYRYYPEMLSSGMLSPEYSKAIINLRENLGGELLGMTRFWDGLDDWPAYNLALYYLEAGLISKYQLLMYSHILFHGLSSFYISYEQPVFATDKLHVFRDSCLPCCLLAPIMIMQMFCFEPIKDDSIELLKGIPDSWLLTKQFSIKRVQCSCGMISINVENNDKEILLNFEFSGKHFMEKDIIIYLNGLNIKSLTDMVYEGMVLVLEDGCLKTRIKSNLCSVKINKSAYHKTGFQEDQNPSVIKTQ